MSRRPNGRGDGRRARAAVKTGPADASTAPAPEPLVPAIEIDSAVAEPKIPAVAPLREASFLQRGRADFMTMLREASDYRALSKTPYGLRPVMVFVLIGALSSFTGRIFGQAAPEIIRDLDLDLNTLFGVTRIIGFVLIFAAIGLAFWGDRVRRIPFVGIGAILAGIASTFSAGARSIVSLGIPTAAADVGDVILDTPIGSLNADYYPVDMRGKVIAFSRVIGRSVGLATPLLVAYIVTATSLKWRLPYLIGGPLLAVAGVLALLLLKEPVRGYMERRAYGLPEDVARIAEEPVSFGEAWRTIWGIRTLRRLFLSNIPGVAGDGIYGFFFALFLFQKYGLSISDRAWISTISIAAALPAGFMAGGLVDVLTRRNPSRVLVMYGLLGIGSSLALFLYAAGPPLWLLVIAFTLFSALGALIGPARSVLFLQILPAHVRNLGSAVTLLAAIPGGLAQFFAISYVLSRWGIQGALFVSAPFILLSAFIDLSAAAFFERDMKAAQASQLASAEWRRAKESGTGKMLVCRAVDVEYDGVQVLFGIDFDVEEGQLIALLGTNGAGKSTLLKAIAGIQEASGGAIVYNGRDITHMPPHEISRRGIVLMPGGRGVFPGLTVRENLLLGNWLTAEDEAPRRLEEVYEIFPVLRERLDDRAGVLSGGEQQMLALSQAFLSRPSVLMIDELSLGLSPAVIQQLLQIVRRIHASGTTIILVEQSVNVALTVAERAVFMEKGQVKFTGRTADLLLRPDILRAVYVKGTGALTEGAPASAMKTERERREYELSFARPVLQVQEVSKSYGGVRALDDVSLELKEGEVLGIIGPNGAGKTTLFDLISGYQRPDRGRVIFGGTDVTEFGADQRARMRLVRRFQDARLFPSLSVYENILVALDQKLDVRSMALTALQLPQVRQSERRVRQRAERLVELLELGAFRDKFARELSTGLRRITDIACALASEPRVLLMDEPSSGIAQAEAESLVPLLRRVRYEIGCSILIIEHDMPLISKVSDELVAMVEGQVVVRGTPDEVLNDDRIIEAYLGTSEDAIQRSGVRT